MPYPLGYGGLKGLSQIFPFYTLAGVRDPEGIEARRRGLERFLSRVSSHPVLGSAKLFHTFLTAKDEKVNAHRLQKRLPIHHLCCLLTVPLQEWKIGRHNSSYKLPKSAKKLFGAPVYSAVKYPAYNVPLNQ